MTEEMNECERRWSAELASLQAEFRMFIRVMDERDKRYEQRFNADDKARELYSKNAELWREDANHWRGTMNDKDRNFVTTKALWGYILSGMFVAVAIATLIFRMMGA